MLHLIRKWVNNLIERRRKKTLEIIKKAKQAFLNRRSPFMCCCFYYAEPSFWWRYDNIIDKIPEFKPETFGVTWKTAGKAWWVMSDRASRLKAFDKLIEIYSK